MSAGLTASAFAQNDDPDNLTVPEGLQNATENTAESAEPTDPDAPRIRIPDDARKERIVGELLEVNGNTLVLKVGNEQRTVRVPSGVKVLRDEKPVSVGQLQPKDTIRIERGISPDSVVAVVAASPAPVGERDPDQQLRSQRRQEAERQPTPRVVQEQSAPGGRVWVVLLESNAELLESGLRAGDVIVVANQQMLQSEAALQGLAGGLFPLRAGADGQVIISPNAAGTGILGAGAVPTGVNIGVPATGTGAAVGTQNGRINRNREVPRSNAGDQNFGPPIGRRPGQDRNFGPEIGTGNNPVPGAGQQQPQGAAGQQQPQGRVPQQTPQQAPPAP